MSSYDERFETETRPGLMVTKILVDQMNAYFSEHGYDSHSFECTAMRGITAFQQQNGDFEATGWVHTFLLSVPVNLNT